MSQQTLVCLLGPFNKRFSKRSLAIIALSHDALTERQGLPCPTMDLNALHCVPLRGTQTPSGGWCAPDCVLSPRQGALTGGQVTYSSSPIYRGSPIMEFNEITRTP